MYTLQFGEGKPFKVANKKEAAVALKLYRMLSGEADIRPHHPRGLKLKTFAVGLYPLIPWGGDAPGLLFIGVYENTYFLTEALRSYRLYRDILLKDVDEAERKRGAALPDLTEEEEKVAFKIFGHPLEEEYARELDIFKKRNFSIYERGTAELYKDIPLILYDKTAEEADLKDFKERYLLSEYYKLYGERAPEEVVKELLTTNK